MAMLGSDARRLRLANALLAEVSACVPLTRNRVRRVNSTLEADHAQRPAALAGTEPRVLSRDPWSRGACLASWMRLIVVADGSERAMRLEDGPDIDTR
jgi:hypothetical protein